MAPPPRVLYVLHGHRVENHIVLEDEPTHALHLFGGNGLTIDSDGTANASGSRFSGLMNPRRLLWNTMGAETDVSRGEEPTYEHRSDATKTFNKLVLPAPLAPITHVIRPGLKVPVRVMMTRCHVAMSCLSQLPSHPHRSSCSLCTVTLPVMPFKICLVSTSTLAHGARPCFTTRSTSNETFWMLISSGSNLSSDDVDPPAVDLAEIGVGSSPAVNSIRTSAEVSAEGSAMGDEVTGTELSNGSAVVVHLTRVR